MFIPYLQAALNNWDLEKVLRLSSRETRRVLESVPCLMHGHCLSQLQLKAQVGWREVAWGTDGIPVIAGGREWGEKGYYLVMESDQCVSFVEMAGTSISPQAQMSKKSQILYLLINSPGFASAFPLYCAGGKFNLILGSLSRVPTSFPAPRLFLGFCEPLEASRKEALCLCSYL